MQYIKTLKPIVLLSILMMPRLGIVSGQIDSCATFEFALMAAQKAAQDYKGSPILIAEIKQIVCLETQHVEVEIAFV